ncbi:MAG TPA: RsmE family RNA methyltransferase [Gemmataceae bacterium]|nr:RsmE family RNA methyltransferase [Gemmataceae bacterium]
MSERFYINWPLQPGPVTLDGPEARHLATVCRIRPGDAVCLFNGDGHEYPARVLTVERRQIELEVVQQLSPERELKFHLEVAAPLPKGDRAQFLIEKLTELGVKRYVPLETERSVVQPSEAKLEKLERYVVEASKQCGRNTLMVIAPLVNWMEYCKQGNLPERRILGHPQGISLLGKNDSGSDVVCAVGPEGGFTEQEVQTAVTCGWQTVNLGSRILRVETAAMILAAAASVLVKPADGLP